MSRTIGLIAGWGQFPVSVARTLKQQGHCVICVAVKGHADPALAKICDEYRVFGIGRMAAQTRFLKQYGVTQATMAGKIFKTLFYDPRGWISHFPDLATARHFYRTIVSRTGDRRDDTLLTSVTQLYADRGIVCFPATDCAPELLVPEGSLTRRRPTASQFRDIEFGWKLAREMGRLDVGQSVVVKDQAVLAIEAIEGTDACITRAGTLCKIGGFTVVKVAKPAQDMRFDVPTIGVGTIESIHRAGGSLLAIEADRTIVIDMPAVVATAERCGVTVIAMQETAGKLRNAINDASPVRIAG